MDGSNKQSKKVGIITLPGKFNYGNRLQCYAAAKAIESIGCTPSVLELEYMFPWYRRAYYVLKRHLLHAIGRGAGKTPEQMSTPARLAAFDDFEKLIPVRRCKRLPRDLGDQYDRFVIGSDQVWNPHVIAHQEYWYFAEFAKREQRIALAASLGIETFDDEEQAARIAAGVRGFTSVSVREKKGAELIKACSGVTATVICDPTLTLSATEWRSVAKTSITPKEPYIFTYLLGGFGAEARSAISGLDKGPSTRVVSIADRQKAGELDAGPAEFLSLIDNAAHVVTDSFHAAVFASVLETPLTIVHREGGASMFSRLEQLSNSLGIENKVFGSPSFDLSRAGDYAGVPEAIARERKKFMSYLEACLNG